MAARERQAGPRPAATKDAAPATAKGGTHARADEIRKDLDALIDEIDGALEENAEEFLNTYV